MDIEEQKKQWRAALATNEKIQGFFAKYMPYSVESFIDQYLFKKSMWMQYGGRHVEDMETEGVQWVYSAFEHLQYIQQKKLFDVQCLWRAEQSEVKEITVCCDFQVWEKNILNCHFIDPVTAADIELYQQYLLHENGTDPGRYEEWQNYEELKEAYETDNASGDFPDWYEFYDQRKGTGVLLALPDIRGQKEEFYKGLVREDTAARQQQNDAVPEMRPYLDSYDKLDWFVNTFEDKDSQQLYKAYMWNDKSTRKAEMLEDDLEFLFSIDEPIPIAAHDNWVEAVQQAAKTYRNKKISEALPQAWEQYMINIQAGIGFADNGRDSSWLKKMHIDLILKGRALNGEPENLDF